MSVWIMEFGTALPLEYSARQSEHQRGMIISMGDHLLQ
jgi:hypothetical protein